MLHITNGDHAADRLRQSGIEGEVMVWRELYTFGPVVQNMGNEVERSKRAAYLEQQLGIPRRNICKLRSWSGSCMRFNSTRRLYSGLNMISMIRRCYLICCIILMVNRLGIPS